MDRAASFRDIPSVDEVLRAPDIGDAISVYGRAPVTEAARAALAALRRQLAEAGEAPAPDNMVGEVVARTLQVVASRSAPTLRRVVNLTGTIIHTNLGRSPLPSEAVQAMVEAALHPSNLEFDLREGQRSDRDEHVEPLLQELTGCEAATVVNNNAAAVVLALNTLALRKEAIVSRGQLVEIGGSFRLPDIMARAGAKLREVGTTNRTHAADFQAAIGASTGLVMEAHTSNYAIEGFTASVPTSELADLAHARGLPLLVDLGSGSMLDLRDFGLPGERTVAQVLREGADLVTFSGDKLLGGPQAGIIVGAARLIERIKRNPLKRVLRVDKLTLAALSAVLRLYADPARAAERIPVLRLLRRTAGGIEDQARRVAPLLAEGLKGLMQVEIVACDSQVGSGALPRATIPSAGLALRPVRGASRRATPGKAAAAFRGLAVPVLGRVRKDALVFDLRCLADDCDLTARIDKVRAMLEEDLP
jgi:L-seryl-tRNA(Ser) seleniumtransferase